MTWISNATTIVGVVFLIHACYSAQEHAALQATKMTATELPIDISIEAIAATLMLSLGLALGTPGLRPVKWHVWAGKIEREGHHAFSTGSSPENDVVVNPFSILETRPGFVDIRKNKSEFAAWVKSKPQ